MIDINKAEKEFEKYTNNFNMNESHIERKIRHTFRVERLCEEIAESLKMTEEEINLARLIGILHDIARFEQYTKYKSYADEKTIDHGDLAVDILKKDNYIRKFIETDKYDEIILKAIKYHNKYEISKDVTKKERIFCEIIRDADKLDILYQGTCEMWKDIKDKMEIQLISPMVLEQFLSKKIVDKNYINYDIDRLVVVIGFIYDFNFKNSYKIIKENNYINNIFTRFNFEKEETKKQMKEIRELANKYIEEKIKED